MTSFYDKFNLNKNVLKDKFTLNYNDYEKLKISEQYNKLYSNTYKKNESDILLNENKKIYNLSINELINQAGPIYISLINDLSIFFSKDENDKSFNKLGLILTKENNLLYIGVLILVLSFSLWLINVTL